MTQQVEIFHDTWEDALADVVNATGGWKRVGNELWPDKSPDEAGRYLRHCLTNGRDKEKLSLTQILWLLRRGHEAGIHTAIAWLSDAAGYTRPEPVTDDDRRDAAARELTRALSDVSKLLGRYERLGGDVRAIK